MDISHVQIFCFFTIFHPDCCSLWEMCPLFTFSILKALFSSKKYHFIKHLHCDNFFFCDLTLSLLTLYWHKGREWWLLGKRRGPGKDKGVLGEEGRDRRACRPQSPDSIFWCGLGSPVFIASIPALWTKFGFILENLKRLNVFDYSLLFLSAL